MWARAGPATTAAPARAGRRWRPATYWSSQAYVLRRATMLLLGSVSILPLNHSWLDWRFLSHFWLHFRIGRCGRRGRATAGVGLEPQRTSWGSREQDMDVLLSKAAELLAAATSQADLPTKAHYQGSLSMFEALAAVQQPIAQCVTACPNRRPLLLGA